MLYEEEVAAAMKTWCIELYENLCGDENTKETIKNKTGFRCRRIW